MGTAAALKSALYIRRETNCNVCTCARQVFFSPRLPRTTQCNRLSFQELFFIHSQANPACSPSIIPPKRRPSICRICHRRSHLNLQLVVFALSSKSPSNRDSCGVPPWHPSSSGSHAMDCCSDLQLPSSSSPNVSTQDLHSSSVRSSDSFCV